MYGVVRFEDTELIPASSPEDYPKIIKSGIEDTGQHPLSPAITGPSGIATVLYRIGRPELLERLLDVEGTHSFDFSMHFDSEIFLDSYVHRRGRMVEIGFMNENGEEANQGVRYLIEDSVPPYKIGAWKPVSTSDMGSPWGGSEFWVRGHGEAVAKGLWYNEHWNGDSISVLRWSGMTEEQKGSLDRFRYDFAEKSARRRKEQKAEDDRKLEALAGTERPEAESDPQLHRKW
ncbi:hypothetical protein EDD18DRAFT_1278824 [Armillaria luteobubalina]|uniref:Uncharacterized protein n=1 Tax=Armillaria luteobubalina TaxID=153913 RepID=A0AA39TV12_9AGAR|nr:hypothetical protein EDD18DRAFT_1278824 [Armillaria luteobubalina]